jgi:hypothetical protein
MPFEIWFVLLLISVGCALYLFFIKDHNNYTEAIAGFLSTIFFILSGYALMIGITAENSTVDYNSTSIGWLFIMIGIIVGIISFVRVLDIINARSKETHVNMSRIHL